MKFRTPTAFATLLFLSSSAFADWPQWRGPDRTGTAAPSAVLPDLVEEDYEPVKLWESSEIPSDHYGGHGSISIADGRLYVSLVWHRDEPTENRRFNSEALANLDHRGTHSIPEEIREKMEHDRMNLSRRLRGAALEEWAKEWVEEHLDEKTQLSLGGWVINRFKKGEAAIPLSVYEVLREASGEVFANQAEMEAWVAAQNFSPSIRDQVIRAVPSTVKVADDVIICLDTASGEEVWRFVNPGYPSGRGSSSTPAVVDGRVVAALSEHLYCVDAASGEEIWRSPLTGRKGPASSPLVHENQIFLQQNLLSAFDLETGEELWQNKDVKLSNPSPAVWENLIICNSQQDLIAVDAESGATVWTAPGGGDGTPVVSGNHLVISSRQDGKNLIAYELSESGAEEIWSLGFLARRYGSSPIIHEGNVYYMGSDRHLCVDLNSGEIQWEREAQSSISSPIIADGKLLVYENRGGFAHIIRAAPQDYYSVGRAKVGALFCASPALVGKDLYLRTARSVVAYRFE